MCCKKVTFYVNFFEGYLFYFRTTQSYPQRKKLDVHNFVENVIYIPFLLKNYHFIGTRSCVVLDCFIF